MSREPTVSSRLIFRGQIATLRVDEVRLGSGRLSRREIVEHPGAAAVVAVTDEREVLLVRQYRKAIERELLEIPAGTLDPNESPLACAHRELAEETGTQADVMVPLITFAPSPGILTEEITVFLAQGLRSTPQHALADEEGMVVERVSLDRVPALIHSGEIQDAKSLIGLMLLLWREGGVASPR